MVLAVLAEAGVTIAAVPSSRAVWVGEIKAQLAASADVMRKSAASAPLLAGAAGAVADCFGNRGKLLLCGNGGSAADAQQVATELVARYKRERRGLPAIALASDATYLTAQSNDFSFASVFARQVEALGTRGDVLWAFSTRSRCSEPCN